MTSYLVYLLSQNVFVGSSNSVELNRLVPSVINFHN